MANFIIGMFNVIIKALGFVISIIFALLPPSPFKIINNSIIQEYLPTLNFFIPVAEIIVVIEAWILCIGVYYLYQIVLRWVKAIN